MKLSSTTISRFQRRILNRWKLQRSSERRVPSVGIASGKGGTGKTFTTVNLAVLLAPSIGPVQIFDTDLGLGNAHLHLGLKPERHLDKFFEGKVGLDRLVLESPYEVSVLPGGSGISRLAQLGQAELRMLARSLPAILEDKSIQLIDSAAGISPQTLLFLQHTDLVLLVVTPHLASLTDAYALIKCLILRKSASRMLVLVNRADHEEQALEAFSRIRKVSCQFLSFPVHYLGCVPEDRAVQPALAAKVPVVIRSPHSSASRALGLAARKLKSLLMESEEDWSGPGFAESLGGSV
ncbi:MAG: MinD/ParA family protein [Planctomycetota bacterium]